MVGSSASDGVAGALSVGFAGGGGGGIAASTLGGAGGGGKGGTGAGAGAATTAGGGGLDGRGPAPPGMKEKSSASDDEIHGTCSLREARVTPTRVRFSDSSAIRSGVRISLRSSRTNRLWSVPLSELTDDNAA